NRGSELVFMPKMHYIHGDPRLSFRASFSRGLPQERLVSWLFWEGSFSYRIDRLTQEDMASFVRRHDPGDPQEDREREDNLLLDQITATQRELVEARAELLA